MTATVKHTEKAGDWASVSKAFDVVRRDLRRDLKKLEVEATTDREKLDKALREIVDVLEEGFTTAAKSVRDPQLHKHLVDVAKAIRAALRNTASRGKVVKTTTVQPKAKATVHRQGARPAKR
jgi:hypothetical protein